MQQQVTLQQQVQQANATEAATSPAAENQTLAVVETNATDAETGAPLANDTVASDIDTNATTGAGRH